MKYGAADDEPDEAYGKNPPPGYESRASRRELFRNERAKANQARVKQLKAEIAHLIGPGQGCSFCVGLPHGAADLKFDCNTKFGLKISGDVVSCPQCSRVMAEWE